MTLYKLKLHLSSFYSVHKSLFTKFYWIITTGIIITLLAVPITFTVTRPDVRLPDIHGIPTELIREWDHLVSISNREQARKRDFIMLTNHLTDNFPFFEAITKIHGVNITELAAETLEHLNETARHQFTPETFSRFVNEYFFSKLGSFGGLSLTGDGSAASPWLMEPYFFGFYDWRFYDDRFYVPIREGNVSTEISSDNTAHIRINRFLPRGYEPVTRHPFLYFDFESDKLYLLDFFEDITDFDYLIIDIRGIGSGFGDYFLPLILSPLIRTPMHKTAYAFHTDGFFASRVSEAFRAWYGFGEISCRGMLTTNFNHTIPQNLSLGFRMNISAIPTGSSAFNGQVKLLTDSANFSGPNFIYLQMAAAAGFLIEYEENPNASGWELSFFRLPNSRLSLRYNPLYFTDDKGRPFEVFGG